jgi:hypothetical protein
LKDFSRFAKSCLEAGRILAKILARFYRNLLQKYFTNLAKFSRILFCPVQCGFRLLNNLSNCRNNLGNNLARFLARFFKIHARIFSRFLSRVFMVEMSYDI